MVLATFTHRLAGILALFFVELTVAVSIKFCDQFLPSLGIQTLSFATRVLSGGRPNGPSQRQDYPAN
jgi:hypothetical protein